MKSLYIVPYEVIHKFPVERINIVFLKNMFSFLNSS